MAPDTSIALAIVLAFIAGSIVSVVLYRWLWTDSRAGNAEQSTIVEYDEFSVTVRAKSPVMRWLIVDSILPSLDAFGTVIAKYPSDKKCS